MSTTSDETMPLNEPSGEKPSSIFDAKTAIEDLVKDIEPDAAFLDMGDTQKIVTRQLQAEGMSITIGYRDEGDTHIRRYFFQAEWINPKDLASRIRGLRRFKEVFDLDRGEYKKTYKDDTNNAYYRLENHPIDDKDEARMLELIEIFRYSPSEESKEVADDKGDKK